MVIFGKRKDHAPCYGCKERHEACHDTCEKFKESKEYWKKLEENRNKLADKRAFDIERHIMLQERRRKQHR